MINKKFVRKGLALSIIIAMLCTSGCSTSDNKSSSSKSMNTTNQPNTESVSGQSINAQEGENPPDKPPEGGGEKGTQGAPGGESSSSADLTAADTADGKDESSSGKELASSSSDENVILAKNSGSYTLSKSTLTKSGDTSSADNSNFYGVNAIAAAASNSTIDVSDSKLSSSAEGANGIFATGENAKATVKNTTIKTTANSSRGLDATNGGEIKASNVTISTSGDHSGAIATDRGGGTVSVDGATVNTSGQGSPLVYSTGNITLKNAKGEATGSQIVGMEGLNQVKLVKCTLTGSAKKASEPVANGVILYQSMSGDSSTGCAEFEAKDCTLKSYINDGAMFYVTNTSANVVLNNTKLDFDTENNTFVTAAGNDGSNNWGTKGSNGGKVTVKAINQSIAGDISCDGISTVNFSLTSKSSYKGTIVNDTTYTGDGGVSINLENGTSWVVTENCSVKSLTVKNGAKIKDSDGKTVTVKTSDGTTVVKGASSITVKTDTYSLM